MKKNRPTWWALLVLGLAGAAGLASTSGTYVEAADHLDPPARVDVTVDPARDHNADIADVFAWADTDTERTTVIMSFAGPNPAAADQAVPCDRDVLYQIHIDTETDADFTDNFTIDVRLGEDDDGNCFYRIEGVPGTASGEVIVGPVGYQTDFEDVNAMVGLFDDAFFFDLAGFRATVAMGTLFDTSTTPATDTLIHNDVDFFARLNTPAIVVEFPTLAVSSGDVFRVWASTSRLP